jgi:hypothetical protein
MPPLKNPKKLAVIFLATSPSELQQNSPCKRSKPHPNQGGQKDGDRFGYRLRRFYRLSHN